jgi:hypothetical protein
MEANLAFGCPVNQPSGDESRCVPFDTLRYRD